MEEKDIYREAYDAIVLEGKTFSIDIIRRDFIVDGKYMIKKGRYEGLLGIHRHHPIDFLKGLDRLYHRYKHSRPSRRSESMKSCYFKSLRENELEDEDMLYGEEREHCRFFLEFFVLTQILQGFKWDEALMGKWFWQSEKDKDLVLLRQWIEPGYQNRNKNKK